MNAPTIITPNAIWLANGTGITYTQRKVAVGYDGTGMINQFELKGNGKCYNNFYVDSLITSWHLQTQQIEATTAIITGDLTADKLTVNSTVLFNSLSGSGNGLVGVDSTGTFKRYNMTGSGHDVFLGDGTFGNLSSATGWQWYGNDLVSNAQRVVIQRDLAVGGHISVGVTKIISNGSTIDTMRTSKELQIISDAERIDLRADTVRMKDLLEAPRMRTPQLTVSGDASVSGTVNSGEVNAANVVANKIESKELVSDSLRIYNKATVGLLQVRDSIKIGNSIWLGGKDQNTGNYNAIYSSDGALGISARGSVSQNPFVGISVLEPVAIGLPFAQWHLFYMDPLPKKLIVSSVSSDNSTWTLPLQQGFRLENYHFQNFPGTFSITQRSSWDFMPVTPGGTLVPRLDFNSVTTNKTVLTLREDGNVGIGTTNPTGILHIVQGGINRIRIGTGGDLQTEGAIGTGWNNFGAADALFPILTVQNSSQTEVLRVASSGNVGIGTTSPQRPLHIKGDDGTLNLEGISHTYIQWYPDGYSSGRKAWTGFGLANDNNFTIKNEITDAHIILSPTGNGNVGIGTTIPGARLHVVDGGFRHGGTGEINIDAPGIIGGRLKILDNGNVGIGTTSPPSGFRLAVAGNIIAEEVWTDVQADWPPDYVFKEDYNLRTLDDLRKQINRKGHHPNFPSASEMVKEGRINLKEMHRLEIKTLEEAYLHILQLDERLNQSDQKFIELEEKYNALNRELDDLKKK